MRGEEGIPEFYAEPELITCKAGHVECMKWSGSERVSRECSEDILMKVIDLIDIFFKNLKRERGKV